jgi:hypothetical protein
MLNIVGIKFFPNFLGYKFEKMVPLKIFRGTKTN